MRSTTTADLVDVDCTACIASNRTDLAFVESNVKAKCNVNLRY